MSGPDPLGPGSPFTALPMPRKHACLPLRDLAHVAVLACPRGCDLKGVCQAATPVRKGDWVHYTPHVEACSRAGARS